MGEVDTSLLIFKGLFTTGEELVLTVVPMVDLLPTLLRNLVSKKTILNMLNLDSVKSEIMGMSDETARFYVKQLKAIPKKERDEGLALLKVLETMLKLVEEDADYSCLRRFCHKFYKSCLVRWKTSRQCSKI